MPSLSFEREQDACEAIADHAEAALRLTAGMTFATFEADLLTQYAVVRCLDLVSKASLRLGPELKARHPGVPWRDIADAGHLYHPAYHHAVSLDIAWRTVHDQLNPIVVACHAELGRPLTP